MIIEITQDTVEEYWVDFDEYTQRYEFCIELVDGRCICAYFDMEEIAYDRLYEFEQEVFGE